MNYSTVLAEIENQTQRVTAVSNISGEKVRVRFSNRYSSRPLKIERVTIGIWRNGCQEKTKALTLKGAFEINLAPGEECFSDETKLPVSAGDWVSVSIYVKETQKIESICSLWSAQCLKGAVSRGGDYTSGASFEAAPFKDIYGVIEDGLGPVTGTYFFGLSGIQVLTDEKVTTVTAFGDSITHMSYVTDALYQRLMAAYPGKASLINRGIGGNRLLADAIVDETIPGKGSSFGRAGVERFERDVFLEEPPDAVIVLEGVNDILQFVQFGLPPEGLRPEDLLRGYEKLASIARRHGAKFFVGTIPPWGDAKYTKVQMAEFERIRLAVNGQILEELLRAYPAKGLR